MNRIRVGLCRWTGSCSIRSPMLPCMARTAPVAPAARGAAKRDIQALEEHANFLTAASA